MRALRAFGRFWWDFVVGDDWRIATGVTVVLTAAAILVSQGASHTVVAVAAAAGVAAVAVGAILRSAP